MDNASSNNMVMKELQRHLHEHDIEFDAADQKVMCFGHIVDLISGHVINGFTKTRQLADENEDWSTPPAPSVPSQQTYEEAVARDPIAIGCVDKAPYLIWSYDYAPAFISVSDVSHKT